jgi:hypothetical protein
MLLDARSVQRFLQARSFYKGTIDGDYGPGSDKGGRAFLASLGSASLYQSNWPKARARIAVEQAILKDLGFYLGSIDGYAGPASQAAVEKWQDFVTFDRPPLPEKAIAHQKTIFPRQKDVERFYGRRGENQTTLVPPYPLRPDWALKQTVRSFSIHEKCHDSALRVMNRVLDHFGPAKIKSLGLDQFGGCLNVRKMRNSSTWSMHSWGIAIDWDPDRNSLRATSRTAALARTDRIRFLQLWEEEGWVSLGLQRNFDWMHVQAARL